jgi:crotonobetainyl-CoA:carnitine CoA-transferase CaiB-like acyl-CoA transferase
MTVSALSGIKVLDMSRVLAGPLCAMMLGDLGADVIKVERPGGGDETRGWGPPFDDRGESAYFLCTNRNKRSLTADLSQPADQQLLRELIAEADVVIENFLPGSLARKNIDYVALLALNPRLVWCTIRGYMNQPSRLGYDFAMQAESGWMSVTGEPDGAPIKTAVAFVDILTGKDAAIAVLAALVNRAGRSAAERFVEVSLSGSAIAALANVAQNALVSGKEAQRWGNAHANLVPYQLFDTADVPLVVAVGSDSQWLALVELLDDPALMADPAFRTNAGRVADRARCVEAVQRQLLKRPADDWQSKCEGAGVPVGRVRTVLEALREHETSPLYGVPSSVGGSLFRAPPLLGEHSAEIRRSGWG